MAFIDSFSGQVPLTSNDQYTAVTPNAENKLLANDNKMFGNDGFTFFDFLDIINPLQHVPVISTIYRSITGDHIDPGSRIAGATLFGGPLAGALTSMDVAIKQETGRDIAAHTAMFFTGATVSSKNPGNPGILTVPPTTITKEIGTNTTKITALVTPEQEMYEKETPPKKFNAAGMAAIPLAKHKNFFPNHNEKSALSSKSDLNIALKTQTPFPQLPAKNENLRETRTPKLNNVAIPQPRALTPKFSASALKSPRSPLNKSETRVDTKFATHEHSEILIKEGWVIDAMLKGLGKYSAAGHLTKTTNRPKYSGNR